MEAKDTRGWEEVSFGAREQWRRTAQHKLLPLGKWCRMPSPPPKSGQIPSLCLSRVLKKSLRSLFQLAAFPESLWSHQATGLLAAILRGLWCWSLMRGWPAGRDVKLSHFGNQVFLFCVGPVGTGVLPQPGMGKLDDWVGVWCLYPF